MSIKQSIALFVLFWGVSFSAFAEYLRVASHGGNHHLVSGCTGIDIGSVVKVGSRSLGNSYDGGTCESVSVTTSQVSVSWRNRKGSYSGSMYGAATPSCPSGEVPNPETGECEEPPTPYCEKQSTIDQMNQFKDSCWDKGSGWTPEVSCNDASESLEMTCNPPPGESCEPGSPSFPACLDDDNKCDENSPNWDAGLGMCCSEENNYCDIPPPESCTIMSPNWPECAGDTDIDPPSGGDLDDPSLPDGGGSGNPDPDKPEPDVEDKPDANQAVKALNEDMNKQLTALNNDMNKNHAENKSALDALKASVDLGTQTSVDAANHIKDAIERDSAAQIEVGNTTNSLLTSANHLLNNGFGTLAGDLNDLQGINSNGFGDVVGAVEGLGEKLDGFGEIHPSGGVGPGQLYSDGDYASLLSDVAELKEEYKSILNDFKNYFNFNSGVNSGDFNSHSLGLNWHGHEINKENQVLKTLREHAGIISSVVIFMFGLAGIKVIMRSL